MDMKMKKTERQQMRKGKIVSHNAPKVDDFLSFPRKSPRDTEKNSIYRGICSSLHPVNNAILTKGKNELFVYSVSLQPQCKKNNFFSQIKKKKKKVQKYK